VVLIFVPRTSFGHWLGLEGDMTAFCDTVSSMPQNRWQNDLSSSSISGAIIWTDSREALKIMTMSSSGIMTIFCALKPIAAVHSTARPSVSDRPSHY
jgi:hypothetical protein